MNTDLPDAPPGGASTDPGAPTAPDIWTRLSSDQETYNIADALLAAKGYTPGAFREHYPMVIENLEKCVPGLKSPPSMLASELVRNEPMWMQWAKSVGLHYGGIDYSPEIGKIEGNVKYPLTLQTLETRIDELEPNMNHFIFSIKAWTQTDRAIRWDAVTNSSRLWEPLLNPWSLMKDAVCKGLGEATHHFLADQMLHLIFYQSVRSEDERYEIILESSLALPLPTADNISVVISATVDAIAMKVVPSSVSMAISHAFSLARSYTRESIACLLSPTDKIKLGVFPLEARGTDESAARHRVELDLCSIQYQRRALCLGDKRVYGATCVGGKFSLYTAYWINEAVEVAFVERGEWDLNDPVQFVKCLYFLRALKKHLDETIQDDFDNFDQQKFEQSLKERNEKSWRIGPGTKRKYQGTSSESTAKKRRTGSGVWDDELDVGDADTEACESDGDDSVEPRTTRPVTREGFVKLLPDIVEEVLKRAAIKDWQLRVASSDHGQAIVHENEPEVSEEKSPCA